ncbi:MAG: hypothetical protein IPI67_02815 [Myxococcales bacterium]|nr:hypothetical protein [Myxococcales bacterium]
MVGRSVALAIVLTLPLPLAAVGTSKLADVLGTRAGRSLALQVRAFTSSTPRTPSPVLIEALPPAPMDADQAAPLATTRSVAAPRRLPPAVPKKGIRVRADMVLRLASAGARPAGFPVAAQGERPRGLALVGVSALGIGLQDGDVLTHAAGRPALTPGDVIGVVIGSRNERAPEIWGRFWRNGEPWNLVVEQPYVVPKQRTARQSGS